MKYIGSITPASFDVAVSLYEMESKEDPLGSLLEIRYSVDPEVAWALKGRMARLCADHQAALEQAGIHVERRLVHTTHPVDTQHPELALRTHGAPARKVFEILMKVKAPKVRRAGGG